MSKHRRERRAAPDLIEDRSITSSGQDRLAHDPAAHALADLVAQAPLPATVGLFGPWGSGKSGVLELAKGRLEAMGFPVVIVDAWRYADQPLARRFLTVAAEELTASGYLGFGRWRFARRVRPWCARRARSRTARRLYEGHRRRRISFAGIGQIVLGLAVAATVLLAWALLHSFLVASGPGRSHFGWQVIRSELERSIVPAGVIALVAGLLSAATVESDARAPGSEEEFESVMATIAEPVVKRRGRLVILVDELDRASAADVAATLKTVRTFLGVPGCVFVLATDRDVLEKAMESSATQPTLDDPPTTYHGSVGSLLDKLFQFQVDLPLVRTRRVTHLALELVESGGGVWEELRPLHDDLIPVLIPGHVRSPRRVKVLLNAFVVALWTARNRHQQLPNEAPNPNGKELPLAKLTCLRTEFPLFARDVETFPQLLDLMTSYSLDLERGQEAEAHVSAEMTLESKLADQDDRMTSIALGYVRAERPLDAEFAVRADGAEDGTSWLAQRRLAELVAYLIRTASVPHPGRELIFGQSLGLIYGLDPDLADSLEDAAVDGRTARALDLTESLDDNATSASLMLLSDLVVESPGIERSNATRVLFEVIEHRAPSLSDASSHLARAMTRFLDRGGDVTEWPVPALSVSAVLTGVEQGRIQEAVLNSSSWRSDEAKVQRVVASAAAFTPDAIACLRGLLPEILAQHPSGTVAALCSLNARKAVAVWERATWLALPADLDNADTTATVARHLASADRSAAWTGVDALLEEERIDEGLAVALAIGGARSSDESQDLLRRVADETIPPAAWDQVRQALPEATTKAASNPIVDEVLRALAAGVEARGGESESATELAEAVAAAGFNPTESIEVPSASRLWWTSDLEVQLQRAVVYQLGRFSEIWPNTKGFASWRLKYLLHASGNRLDGAAGDLFEEQAVLIGPKLQPEARERLLAAAEECLSEDRVVLVRTKLWAATTPAAIPPVLLDRIVNGQGSRFDEALGVWIGAGRQSWRAVWNALQKVGPDRWSAIAKPVGELINDLGRKRSGTSFVTEIVKAPRGASQLLLHVSPEQINQTAAAQAQAAVLDHANNSEERREALRQIAALGIVSLDQQRVLASAVVKKFKGGSKAAASDLLTELPINLLANPRIEKLVAKLSQKKGLAQRTRDAIRTLLN